MFPAVPAFRIASLELDTPVIQAGMAGVARARLAGAVSRAGGLGTLGLLPPDHLRSQIRAARRLAGDRPIAVNLLMPFARREHLELCVDERVAAVSLFFGFRRSWVERLRENGIAVLHQVGTVAEAERALADGADALIAQGLEAGGHLLATQELRAFLPQVLAVAAGRPVIAAGGIFDRASAERAIAAGAHAVAMGTRFLLTPESHAHDAYKQRLLSARRTVVTELFGFGWPARHRVVPNAAFERWCEPMRGATRAVLALERLTGALGRALPLTIAPKLAKLQSVGSPLYSPALLDEGLPAELADVTALYAGACVEHIDRLVEAGEIVRTLLG
jgi:NAD(P)H-dependent flavin oxidoreductase YrpB (nitropropane dioxygenase family)